MSTVVDSKSLYGAIPCFDQKVDDIESLELESESTDPDPAVFFVGVQVTRKIYEIISEGLSNEPDSCYDAGLGVGDISSTAYDGRYIWRILDGGNQITVFDPAEDYTRAIYDTAFTANKEGLIVDD